MGLLARRTVDFGAAASVFRRPTQMIATRPIRITLAGDLGSGKSSVGRRIAAALGVPYYSAGALFREIGQIKNLDALKTNLHAENNTDVDFAVDERTREIDRTVASFVIDSRMAWHFVKNATNVYLSVSRDTAARRIMGDGARGAGETYASHAAAVAALAERRSSETRRYRQLYGVDISDPANYDLTVVTDDVDVADIADLVLAAARSEIPGGYWLPKTRLVPMCPFEDAASPRSDGGPLPVTVVHNFGFYFGDGAHLAGALANAEPFLLCRPEFPAQDAETIVSSAKRKLTPGGLGRWVSRAGVGRAFADLLEPARP
jgi:cytidylate kinase